MAQTERKDIAEKYKWDIESMYLDPAGWEADIEKALALAKDLAALKGSIARDGASLEKALHIHDDMWLAAEHAYVYSRMKRDEDNRVEKYQAMNARAQGVLARISSLTSFFIPELLESSEEKVLSFINENSGLAVYEHLLKDVFRKKDHVLSEAEENIIAQFSEVIGASSDVFTMLNNADIDFGTIKDGSGDDVPMSHGNYVNHLRSDDRVLRKNAYEKMYETFRSLINTIAANYSANVKANVTSAKIRGYKNARSASLAQDNVPDAVYDRLVSAVNEELPTLHRYIELKKKLLGTDELFMYDVYAPVIRIEEEKIPYEEAVEIVKKALAPMGEEYVSRLSGGFDDGWVDVMENTGKTSGAYSFGSYDSKPFVLLNYTDSLDDVFTVIHEMGHSMHSSYTRENQPFIYGSHSIFTAEVASTVNENLLMKYLIANEKDLTKRKYLLAKHIEDFRGTVFRQTMFAEFEDMAHREMAENGALTPGWLCDTYDALNTKYFGPALGHDDLIKYEWARIPHFYSAFYVYKYATGYSAASAISDMILQNGAENYIEFLKTGESDWPIELLKIAGVDMETEKPVRDAMKVFRGLVDELEKLTESEE
ncbi:MAG: oligoendopeptidase F [Firmicutes bacterium]|nr:oligoendopeptidase F [Bacillota bacterium]